MASIAARVVYGPPRAVLVIHVCGELDRSNVDELDDALRGSGVVIDHDPFGEGRGSPILPCAVVVDLRETDFVGGAALGLLAQRRDSVGQRLRVAVGARGIVSRALRATGLDCALELYEDFADAVLADLTFPG